MNPQCYVGIDLGAESGRVVAGLWDGAQIQVEEIHRFPNGGVWVRETLRWDVLRLWGEIENGLTLAARKFGPSIQSIGVDTWGVDFVLLSRSGEMLGLPHTYRDARTRGVMPKVFEKVPREQIFAATGVQFMEINTLYQLVALAERSPEILETARHFLMIPDFLNWCLSGETTGELSNASTTQCFGATQRHWCFELIKKLGLPSGIFPNVIEPGARLGTVQRAVSARTGVQNVKVIAPATHDTGSAVAAVPAKYSARPDWAYISSGTWSLMGVEVREPVLTPRALELNFTNERGVYGTFRLLKNIMGLWLVQQCRASFVARVDVSYAELTALAEQAEPFRSLIDPDDARFLNPPDMPTAIRDFCRETNQPIPESEGAIIRCSLESLALKYNQVLHSLEELTGVPVEIIHIVGGGSRNGLLDQLTANACRRPVLAGPVEATVLGNVLMQVRASGEIGSLEEMRTIVANSTQTARFAPEPDQNGAWEKARDRFKKLV
jgi:rhamnulokinase